MQASPTIDNYLFYKKVVSLYFIKECKALFDKKLIVRLCYL